MAAFCLLGMLLALSVLALALLRPWATDSQAPSLSVPPGFEAAVDDAVAVDSPRTIGVAGARVAPAGSPAAIAAAVPASPLGVAVVTLAVSPARPVGTPPAVPVSTPPAESPAAPVTEPVAPSPGPASTPPPAAVQPVPVAGSPSPAPSGAAGAGDPEPECGGDDYTVTIGFGPGLLDESEQAVEILVQRNESDGTVSELLLEGSLDDARSLIELLRSEGNCVEVVVEPASEDGEGEAGVAEAPVDPAALDYLPD